MKNCFGTYDGYSNGCVRCNDYDCIVRTRQNMNTEQIKNTIDSLVALYKLMEKEYGIDLTNEVSNANNVKEEIDEAIRKCEAR